MGSFWRLCSLLYTNSRLCVKLLCLNPVPFNEEGNKQFNHDEDDGGSPNDKQHLGERELLVHTSSHDCAQYGSYGQQDLMDDHSPRSVHTTTCPMEHTLVIGECKQYSEQQEKECEGKRGGENHGNKGEHPKEQLYQEDVALLEMPEFQLAQYQKTQTGGDSPNEQKQACLAFTDLQDILGVQGENGKDDAHTAVQRDDAYPGIEAQRRARILPVILLVVGMFTLHCPDPRHQSTGDSKKKKYQDKHEDGNIKRCGGGNLNENAGNITGDADSERPGEVEGIGDMIELCSLLPS